MSLRSDLKFSVLVNMYNGKQYIDECIQSVLVQTYDNYELIIVDDGSIDGSGEICDKYASENDKITVIHTPNMRQIHARQTAIMHAKGEYLVFLDSDDTMKSNALQVISDAADEYVCDCIIYDKDIMTHDGIILENTHPEEQHRYIDNKRDLYNLIFSDHSYNPLWRKAIRNGLMKKTDLSEYFHVKKGGDLVHTVELIRCCNNAVLLSDRLYNYRLNPTGITRTHKYSSDYVVDYTVNTMVLSFLESETVLSKKDFTIIKAYYCNLLKKQISAIALSQTSYKTKLNIYTQIYTSSFYQQYIEETNIEKFPDNFILFLFKKRLYVLIIMLQRTKCLVQRRYNG